MAKAIHISTLRKMLQAGDPVDISLWKSNGEILHYRNAVPLRYDFYKGTRRIQLLEIYILYIITKFMLFVKTDYPIFFTVLELLHLL